MENQCNTKDRSTDKYTILDSINKDDSKPKHLIIDKRAGSHANKPKHIIIDTKGDDGDDRGKPKHIIIDTKGDDGDDRGKPKHIIIDTKGGGRGKGQNSRNVGRGVSGRGGSGSRGGDRGNKSKDQHDRKDRHDKQYKHNKKPPPGVRNWTPSTDDWIDYGSAGGIIIDPWNHPHNPERYNMFIVKQRANSIWGLPKGHLEKDEAFEYAAMREVMEETGFDFSKLQEGTDYISVPINKSGCPEYPHRIKTHQIHIFVWMLLKPGQTLPKHGRDNREIQDFVWINTNRLRKLLEDKNPNFLCNRTINPKILYQVERACQKGYQMLKEHHSYFDEEG